MVTKCFESLLWRRRRSEPSTGDEDRPFSTESDKKAEAERVFLTEVNRNMLSKLADVLVKFNGDELEKMIIIKEKDKEEHNDAARQQLCRYLEGRDLYNNELPGTGISKKDDAVPWLKSILQVANKIVAASSQSETRDLYPFQASSRDIGKVVQWLESKLASDEAEAAEAERLEEVKGEPPKSTQSSDGQTQATDLSRPGDNTILSVSVGETKATDVRTFEWDEQAGSTKPDENSVVPRETIPDT
ncbi:hypothetical protein QFC19_001074 [Naganishia cerealis]|uniref:Uncharacterized protein n=1 Tax=Naganishia cerealis TaxID=610337 RepID=A0ACC2WJ15_9TREE|nr:hypothetical protein QFC19_001074 [Naganishia cerealis]